MDEIIEKIIDICKRYPEIRDVILLGSYAKGTERKDSDIDLGLIVNNYKKLEAKDYLSLISEVSVETGLTSDIGYINSNSLIYSYEAFTKGKLIYSVDKESFNLIRCNLMGMYLKFNYERREVLDAYRA